MFITFQNNDNQIKRIEAFADTHGRHRAYRYDPDATNIIFIILLSAAACKHRSAQTSFASAEGDPLWQHSESELRVFLDSIGQLNPDLLAEGIEWDEPFLNCQTTLNHDLTLPDFEKLKTAAGEGCIDVDFAKKIFPEWELDSALIENNKYPIDFYSFDENKDNFNEFAVVIRTDDWRKNEIYFFKSKKIIAKHRNINCYSLYLKHFKDETDKTVIYYGVCYSKGNNIGRSRFYFFQYNKDRLIPVLT